MSSVPICDSIVELLNSTAALRSPNVNKFLSDCEEAKDTQTAAMDDLEGNVLAIFILYGSLEILIMQLGYAMYEVGLVRPKNARSALFKVIFVSGFIPIMWWLWGTYIAGDSISFGSEQQNIGGWNDPINFVHAVAIALLTGSMLSGCACERMTFHSFVAIVGVVSSIIFPYMLRVTWGHDGYLYKWGFLDYAGGTSLHVCGGSASLVVTLLVGPRLHRFSRGPEGQLIVNDLPSFSSIFSSLGCFWMVIGWLAYLASASIFQSSSEFVDQSGVAVGNCMLTLSASVLMAIFRNSLLGRPHSTELLNNTIMGALVASTANAGFIQGYAAIILGVCSFCVSNLEPLCFAPMLFGIDDPVDVVMTHLVQGFLGTLFVGLFATPVVSGRDGQGIFYGGNGNLLGVQFCGALFVATFTGLATYLSCQLYMRIFSKSMRVPKHDEVLGLDVRYYDGYAFPDLNKNIIKLDRDVQDAKKRVKQMAVGPFGQKVIYGANISVDTTNSIPQFSGEGSRSSRPTSTASDLRTGTSTVEEVDIEAYMQDPSMGDIGGGRDSGNMASSRFTHMQNAVRRASASFNPMLKSGGGAPESDI